MTKNSRFFLLLLLSVFFLGVSGRLLFSEERNESVSLTLSVRSLPEDSLLFERFPLSASGVTLDGVPVSVLSLSVAPAMRSELRPTGGASYYPSRLTSCLSATLVLEGEMREGHFFSNGIYLPVGKEVTLRSDSFILSVSVLAIKTG